MTACITVDANKAVRPHAALDVGADLSLDEMCHRGAVPLRSGEEGLELVPDDFVKERLFSAEWRSYSITRGPSDRIETAR